MLSEVVQLIHLRQLACQAIGHWSKSDETSVTGHGLILAFADACDDVDRVTHA
ncbi:Hypothetical protein RAK1035_2290 [Roseovarius sp. AK1035]|nr:Hypothetical protein RAK1035_2290 [Roseovarius sp. AK1035]